MILPLLVMRTESSLVRWVWVQCLPMVLLEVGFWCAMISDGFFDVWTPARGFRDGLEVSELENSDTVFKTFRSFHNETRAFIDELFEEEELKSVAGK